MMMMMMISYLVQRVGYVERGQVTRPIGPCFVWVVSVQAESDLFTSAASAAALAAKY